MADATVSEEKPQREPLKKALRDVLILAVVLGGILAFYIHKVNLWKKVSEKLAAGEKIMAREGYADFLAAEPHLLEALELDQKQERALSDLAEINAVLYAEYGRDDRKTKAEDFTRRAERRKAARGERYYAKALLQIKAGKIAEAQADIAKLVNKGMVHNKFFVADGKALLAQGKLKDAVISFRKGVEVGWRSPIANRALAEAYFRQGEYADARNFFEKAIEANPSNIEALLGNLQTHIRLLDDPAEIDRYYTDLLKQPVQDMPPMFRARVSVVRAEQLFALGQTREALEELAKGVALFDKDAGAYALQGQIFASTQDYESAVRAFEKSIELDARVPATHFELVDTFEAMKQPDKADATLAKYALALPADSDYHLFLGKLYKKRGNATNAETEIRKAIELDGFSAEAHYHLGLMLQNRKDTEKALASYEDAAGIRENFPEVYYQVGLLHFDLGNFEDSRESLVKAALGFERAKGRKKPELASAFEALSRTLAKDGMQSEAKQWGERAKELRKELTTKEVAPKEAQKTN